MARIDDGQVLDLLTSLVDKSLAVCDQGADGRARCRLLETGRGYAAERPGELGGVQAALGARRRDFDQALAEETEPHPSDGDGIQEYSDTGIRCPS